MRRRGHTVFTAVRFGALASARTPYAAKRKPFSKIAGAPLQFALRSLNGAFSAAEPSAPALAARQAIHCARPYKKKTCPRCGGGKKAFIVHRCGAAH